MAKIIYNSKKIQKDRLEKIEQVNGIIDEYFRDGQPITIRQIHYRLVARMYQDNTEAEYKNLIALLVDARECGLVDWDAIEDRTRHVRARAHWGSPADLLEAAAEQYAIDLWEGQPYYVEVWIEKDALIGVVENAVKDLDVSCFSCRGYGSATAYWQAAQRIKSHTDTGQAAIILHFGDHDPSGKDMTRDLESRLNRYGAGVRIDRIALNMGQIMSYNLPPQPAKEKDVRTAGYVKLYGEQSWELDAMEPCILDSLIQNNVRKYMDITMFNAMKQRQETQRQELIELAANF